MDSGEKAKGYQIIEVAELDDLVKHRNTEGMAIARLEWLTVEIEAALGDALNGVDLEVIMAQYLGGPYPAIGVHYREEREDVGPLVIEAAERLLREHRPHESTAPTVSAQAIDEIKPKIYAWIDEFLADADPRFAWLRAEVRRSPFLPLYVGWLATVGITPDATVVQLDTELDDARPIRVDDPFTLRFALAQGAKKYPPLRSLLPNRPPEAVDCLACAGTGQLDPAGRYICNCGGMGWTIPNEERDDGLG